MIDQMQNKPETKKIGFVSDGFTTYIVGTRKQANGKYKVIDIAFGNFSEIINDLQLQGYQVVNMKRKLKGK